MTTTTLPARSEIPLKYKWNDTSVFADVAAWAAELESVINELPRLEQYRTKLAEGPETLVEALKLSEAIQRRMWIVYVYASMTHSVDTQDQAAAAMNDRATGAFGKVNAAIAFINPELLAIGMPTLTRWMSEDPRLAVYRHYVDNLFRRQAHVRSAEVEELLGMLLDPFSGAYTSHTMLGSADLRFEPAVDSDGGKHEVGQGSIYTILDSADRELRRTGWEHYRDQYVAFKNTASAQLSTSIKQNVFQMRARGFDSTLAMALDDQNIPAAVYQNLIAAFIKNLPTWHRYWRIRRKALGLDTLHTYDLWAPLVQEPRRIPYEEAVAWICDGLAPMGSDYVDIVRQGALEQRWVDALPNRGKREGAFSSGAPGMYPFILMSYDNRIQSLSTLAHELGHSMHSYYTWKNQPLVYTDYGTFVAEVASNFHQALVRAHLLNTVSDRNLRLGIIEEAMTNYLRYFFIMPTLARFELIAHQRVEHDEALSADSLNELCADLYAEGYGDSAQVDRVRDGVTWATFGHLFSDYYVFQYATGISGANALSQRVLNGAPHAVEDYIGFLSAGSSKYPLDALRDAGVDLSQPEPVQAAFQVLAGYVDRLEELVG